MTKGYIVVAQGEYISQASALALSIQKTQSTVNKISIITDGEVDKNLFDCVIPLAIDNAEESSSWKIYNRTKVYELSPYDETVLLDADMLFLTDVSHWWNLLSHYDLLVTDKVKTYRDEWVVNSPYRRTFIANDLANLYSAFTYFKKSQLANDFFKLVESIVRNWDVWSWKYTPYERQPFPSIDVAMAIASKILDCNDRIVSRLDYPTFTHMKGGCQGWNRPSDQWDDKLKVSATGQKLKLGANIQTGILHYVKKDFIKPNILELFK